VGKINFHINKDYSIKELQEKFSSIYPFLKIIFFKNEHDSRSVTSKSVMYSPAIILHDINKKFSEGELEIDDSMTVNKLESKIFEQFGLSVQVCRKSGNLWLETSLTNHWTLKEQNDHGTEISPNHHNMIYFQEVPYGC
jgi:hypothetical protein